MKRLLSVFLVLCTLFTLVPVTVGTAAAASGADATNKAAGNEATCFADLYVKDGLVARFDATPTTVNLAAGTWTASYGNATATFEGSIWKQYANGSVGYDLLAGLATQQDGSWSFDSTRYYNLKEKARILFDIGLLPKEDYTIEWLAEHKRIVGANADGTPNSAAVYTKSTFWDENGSHPTTVIGTLKDCYDRSGKTLGERGTTRWYLAAEMKVWGEVGEDNGYGNGQLWTDLSRTGFDTFVQTIIRDETVGADATQATIKILKDGVLQKSGQYDSSISIADGLRTSKYFKETESSLFYLFYREPISVYSVRIYSKVLNATQIEQNRIVDVLVKSGAPFSVYASLSEADKKTFLELVGSLNFTATASDIEDIAKSIEDIKKAEAAAREKNAYDLLYVGADGGKTENGGKLTSLFSAFEHTSVLFSNSQSVWYDKMGTANASLIGSLWKKLDGGGIGYTMTMGVATANGDGTYSYDKTKHNNSGEDVYLNLGIDALPKKNFTVEYTVKYNHMKATDANGTPILDYTAAALWDVTSDAIGQLKVIYDRGKGTTLSGNYYSRYFLSPGTGGWYSGAYLNDQMWMEESRADVGVFTQQIVRRVTEKASSLEMLYQVKKSGVLSKSGVYKSDSAEGAKSDICFVGEDSETVFYLFRRAPVDVYAIRIYDCELTAAEMARNYYVDFLAYARLDTEKYYTNLDAETLAFVAGFLQQTPLIKDSNEAVTAIEEALSICEFRWNSEETLYVTDGLVALLASYDGFSTPVVFADGLANWTNAAKGGGFGVLYGDGWKRSADGGLQIRETIPASYIGKSASGIHRANCNYYLSLDYSLLPEKDYTVEVITAPEGITVQNEDGSITPYTDEVTTYGLYHERAFSIGPFRCMAYASHSHVSSGSLEKWFVYHTKGCWDDAPTGARYEIGRDRSFKDITLGNIITYGIEHDFDEENGSSQYMISCDFAVAMKSVVPANKYISKQDTVEKGFDLMRGIASTMYAVRVYDRVLTEAEKLQNRVADICYYLDLDTSLLEEALASIPDAATVFSAFASLSFTMTKEEAQAALDNSMAGIWVRLEDVGVKNDMSDALRFYFDLQYSSIAAIMAAGFEVELGTLVGLGTKQAPTADGAYDYRFVAFDSVSGANAAYLLDEDTYAITVRYFDADTALYTTRLNVVSYVKLTDKQSGAVSYFYGGLKSSEYSEKPSLFSVYKALADKEHFADTAMADYMAMTAENCYEEVTVHVSATASANGDGSKQNPYGSFNDAFDRCKELLTNAEAPLRLTLLLGGGTHRVDRVAELDFGALENKYYYFSIEGDIEAEEPAELTTALDIPYTAFRQVEGKDSLYAFTFDADAKGAYPAFRNFYVDGWSASMAHGTETTTTNGEQPYVTRYDRDVEGAYIKAKYYFDREELEEHAPSVEYAGLSERPELLAAYTKHYEWFLAYSDLQDKYYKPGFADWTVEDVRSGMGADYAEAFRYFKEQFIKVQNKELKASDVSYKVATERGSRGVLYLQLETVEPLRALVEAKLAAMKTAGTYNPQESFKTALDGLGIELHANAEWCYNIMDLAGIDFDDTVYYYDKRHGKQETLVAVYLDPVQYEVFSIPTDMTMAGRHFFLSNALEFLDTTGEYYYDEANGTVYYYTENGVEELSFSYPTLDNLFVLHNPQNVTFSDLTIWGVDDYLLTKNGLAAGQAGSNSTGSKALKETSFSRRAAIACYNAWNVLIQDCYIHDIGGAGIYMEGRVENTVITGNELEMIGDAGIRIRGRAISNNEFSSKSGAENVTITQNYLHQIAQSVYCAPALYMASCKDVEIANNTVIGCSYSGMSIGWSWSAATWEEGDNYNLYNVNIHHNYLTRYMTEMEDGGAIYVLGGNLKPDNPKQINFIHHNFVVFDKYTGNGLGGQSDGYYFDGSSTNWSNYNNIAVLYSAGADRGKLQGASDYDYTHYLRSKGVSPFFMQHTVESAWSYNIHSSDNFIFNVRATTAAKQQEECFNMGKLWAQHGHTLTGTRYYSGSEKLNFPSAVKTMIEETGSRLRPGEWAWLLGNEY